MNKVKFAQGLSSGSLAPSIGWIDFGASFALANGMSTATVVNELPNGFQVCFNLSFQAAGTASAAQTAFAAVGTPTSAAAPFGNVDYTGIPGFTALFSGTTIPTTEPINVRLVLSNIQVVDSSGCQVQDFLFVVADAAYTNAVGTLSPTVWSVASSNSVWTQLQSIPAVNGRTDRGPILTGLGTSMVTQTGQFTAPEETSANVFITQSPSEVVASATLNGTNVAFAFGIIVPCDTGQSILCADASFVNFVPPRACTTLAIDLPDCFQISQIVFGEAAYPVGFGPVVIEGLLGVYVFLQDRVFITSYAEIPPNTFDFFTLILSNGQCTMAIPILFESQI